MYCLSLRIQSFKILCALPNHINGFFVINSVKDTVAAEDDEVVIFLDPESLNLWRGYQHIWITSKLYQLRFDISKGSAYRKASWEDPFRALYRWSKLIFIIFSSVRCSIISLTIWLHLILSWGRKLSAIENKNLVKEKVGHLPVNTSTSICNSLSFMLITRFVIATQSKYSRSSIAKYTNSNQRIKYNNLTVKSLSSYPERMARESPTFAT